MEIAQPATCPDEHDSQRRGSPSGKPLDGFTILEFATIIATPIGVSMLADLGARVIKVEPIGGDPFRGMGGGPLRGLLASKTNAAKKSICIDLKSEEGQAIVAQLIAQCRRHRAQLPAGRTGSLGHRLRDGEGDQS